MKKYLPVFLLPALLCCLLPLLCAGSASSSLPPPAARCAPEAALSSLPDFERLHLEAAQRGESAVSFRSSAFERLLLRAMGKRPGEPVYPSELSAIRCLSVSPGRITLSPDASAREEDALSSLSLLDLQHFTELEHLRIFGVPVDDLFVLPALPLVSLSLSFCSLKSEDCEPLISLDNLKSLSLEGNDLDTASFLMGMCSLEHLSLAYNPLCIIPPLTALSRLRSLSLRSTFIVTLEPLKYLSQLSVLDLSMIGIPGDPPLSLRPLSVLPLLHVLHLRQTAITDTEHIAHVPHICCAGS